MAKASPPPYEVVYSGQQRQILLGLRRIATDLNLRREYLAALRMHHRFLERAPLTWGFPSGELPTLKLKLFTCVFSILLVEYAVDEERHLVYPKTFRFLPGYPPDLN
jgi:hypothetical protein